jgi:hypothetical protein
MAGNDMGTVRSSLFVRKNARPPRLACVVGVHVVLMIMSCFPGAFIIGYFWLPYPVIFSWCFLFTVLAALYFFFGLSGLNLPVLIFVRQIAVSLAAIVAAGVLPLVAFKFSPIGYMYLLGLGARVSRIVELNSAKWTEELGRFASDDNIRRHLDRPEFLRCLPDASKITTMFPEGSGVTLVWGGREMPNYGIHIRSENSNLVPSSGCRIHRVGNTVYVFLRFRF